MRDVGPRPFYRLQCSNLKSKQVLYSELSTGEQERIANFSCWLGSEWESDTREAVSIAYGLLGAPVGGHPLHTSHAGWKPRQQSFLPNLEPSSLLALQWVRLSSSRFSSHLYPPSSPPVYTHACKVLMQPPFVLPLMRCCSNLILVYVN